MRVRHEPAGERTDGDDTRVLATEVEVADSVLAQSRGLMFRRSLPEEYALAFRFDRTGRRDVHTLFVFVPIDVVWVVDDVVRRVERLDPFRGFARERADLIVEFPAGTADGIVPGDRLLLEEG